MIVDATHSLPEMLIPIRHSMRLEKMLDKNAMNPVGHNQTE
jgi:hypothetical protein